MFMLYYDLFTFKFYEIIKFRAIIISTTYLWPLEAVLNSILKDEIV